MEASRGHIHARLWPLEGVAIRSWFEGLNTVADKYHLISGRLHIHLVLLDRHFAQSHVSNILHYDLSLHSVLAATHIQVHSFRLKYNLICSLRYELTYLSSEQPLW